MAFPTTSILDNFNRPDENPATGWAAFDDGTGGPQVVSNQLTQVSAGSTRNGYFTASTYGPDTEVYCTVEGSGPSIALDARISNPGGASSAWTGYEMRTNSLGSQFRLYRKDTGASYTQLGSSVAQTVAAGDFVGLQIIGSALAGWYGPAGVWQSSSIISSSDATYTAAGNIGTFLVGNTVAIDDFGGGTIVSGATNQIAWIGAGG